MKIKYKILFISVTVALFLLGSYYYYKYRQSTIEQMAKEASWKLLIVKHIGGYLM